ncbi:MAG: D-alanine--D-alanine ligase [Verrucomicrobiales bacterium]|nr:D-alanine--D-alanine ligase [Verrucomicrobiales bacterium]
MKELSELKVAVLAGGPGSEREVSLASAKGVVGALEDQVGEVVLVDVTGEDFDLPVGTDIGFNVIHGTFGEDGTLQSLMEEKGVPYTGAREASSRVAFDKILSKECFLKAGVSTPVSETIMVDGGGAEPGEVGIPCVVKPPREGSSVGVHLVHSVEEWNAAISDAAKYSPDVLVEQLIVGKELTVGVLGDEVFPIVHIQPRSGFYDISNKYPWMTGSGGTDYFCPADLPEEITTLVQNEALKAHRSLGVEVYSRVDVLLREEDSKPFVLEVNTIPGMTESSLLPKAAAAAHVDYATLCLKIIKLSFNFG